MHYFRPDMLTLPFRQDGNVPDAEPSGGIEHNPHDANGLSRRREGDNAAPSAIEKFWERLLMTEGGTCDLGIFFKSRLTARDDHAFRQRLGLIGMGKGPGKSKAVAVEILNDIFANVPRFVFDGGNDVRPVIPVGLESLVGIFHVDPMLMAPNAFREFRIEAEHDVRAAGRSATKRGRIAIAPDVLEPEDLLVVSQRCGDIGACKDCGGTDHGLDHTRLRHPPSVPPPGGMPLEQGAIRAEEIQIGPSRIHNESGPSPLAGVVEPEPREIVIDSQATAGFAGGIEEHDALAILPTAKHNPLAALGIDDGEAPERKFALLRRPAGQQADSNHEGLKAT